MKARIFASLVAAILLFAAICSFFAGANTVVYYKSGDWEYTVFNGEAFICKYTGSQTEVTIPSQIGGYDVTQLLGHENGGEDGSLLNGLPVTSVVIPDTVKRLGPRVFRNSASLANVVLPDSLQEIAERAFEDCASLEHIEIPECIASIGADAFKGTAFYKDDANWEDSVLYCGRYLIEAKKDISGSYDIKPGTLIIATNAFRGCKALESVTIPEGTVVIENGAFAECDSLTDVTIPDSVEKIYSSFYMCKSLVSVTIPEKVTEVNGFSDCSSLTGVTLPAGVKEIYPGAFYNCEYLETVYFRGTEEQWNDIMIYDGNDPLLNAKLVFVSDAPYNDASDVNGDGKVNAKDVVDLMKAVVSGEAIDPATADLTDDGKVNAKDVIALMKYVVAHT